MNDGLFRLRRFLVICLALAVTAGSVSGCASLRKKFTRKKKAKATQEEFVPVLEPVQYQRVEYSPADTYKNHFAMARAYFQDLLSAIGSVDAGDKRQKYFFVQVTARLQAMADLLAGEKKAEMEKIISRLQEVVKEYDKAGAMRRYDLMRSSVQAIEKDVRRGFKFDMVKDGIQAP